MESTSTTWSQVTGKGRKILDCAVFRGNTQEREILVSLQNMKKFGIIHETFGLETINDYVYKMNTNESSNYSTVYQVNSLKYYQHQTTKMELKEPSEEGKHLRDELIKRFPKHFVDKLGKIDLQRSKIS